MLDNSHGGKGPTGLRLPGPSAIRWRILALLVTACFVGYLLRSNRSIAGERMITARGLTKVQLGARLVPVMVESLGWPQALAATAVFARLGAALWLVIDAEAVAALAESRMP